MQKDARGPTRRLTARASFGVLRTRSGSAREVSQLIQQAFGAKKKNLRALRGDRSRAPAALSQSRGSLVLLGAAGQVSLINAGVALAFAGWWSSSPQTRILSWLMSLAAARAAAARRPIRRAGPRRCGSAAQDSRRRRRARPRSDRGGLRSG